MGKLATKVKLTLTGMEKSIVDIVDIRMSTHSTFSDISTTRLDFALCLQ